jgi:single-strand DNA-binding protein
LYEPTISLVGNLGNDPDLRYTPNGVAVCDLRVATTPRREVGGVWEDKETLWFTISCWRELAENVAQSFKKGDRLVITGRLLQQTYVREDGSTSTKMLIEAVGVGPDVRRFPVEVKRTVRAGSSADVLSDKWFDAETGEVLREPADEAEAIAV